MPVHQGLEQQDSMADPVVARHRRVGVEVDVAADEPDIVYPVQRDQRHDDTGGLR